MSGIERVLVLGCGYAGAAFARLARARGLEVLAHARSDERIAALRAEGFAVLQQAVLDPEIAAHVDARTQVVVAFPPDGATDARIAKGLAGAAAITYVSSTGAYGDRRGVIDDTTPLPVLATGAAPSVDRVARLRSAEDAYRREGAVVLRCPALYGRDRGLHVRILRGEHSIPGDGTRHLSRIHVDDLAQLILALVPAADAPPSARAGETFVVGDLEPAPHVDVVRFVCETYGVPLPPFVPIESVHESLRADRRVDASRALERSGITLRYPSYREGMAPAATGLPVVSPARAEHVTTITPE
jgi:nucleoside-diphosphate-sugar epimerase